MKLVPHLNFPICNAKTLKLNTSKLLRTQIEPYNSKGTIEQMFSNNNSNSQTINKTDGTKQTTKSCFCVCVCVCHNTGDNNLIEVCT